MDKSQLEQPLEPATEAIRECHDVMEKSLCKARGILFVMSQVGEAELEDEEKQGWAIWAVSDLLADAHDAMHKAQELQHAAK